VAIAMKKQANWMDATAATPNRFAYDHKEMLTAAVARLRAKVQYSTIIKGLMPDTFTLFELKAAHEAILGKPLDKRNFIRHINSSAIITKTGETEHSRRTRPAAKYRFSERAIRIISRM
jgi:8-oxo-dGTP diphosphatase